MLTLLIFLDYFYLLVFRFSSSIPEYSLRFRQYPYPSFHQNKPCRENHSLAAQSNCPEHRDLIYHSREISHIPTAPGVKSLKISREKAEPVSLATCSSTKLLSGGRLRSRERVTTWAGQSFQVRYRLQVCPQI